MSPSSPSRLLVPILCLLAALGIFSTSLYLPAMPAIGKALNASMSSVQLTLAIFFLGSSVGNLFLGPLADRVGRLLVAKGGLILFMVTSFWCAESESILSFQIARFIQGMAVSAGPLVARAVGRDLYEGHRLTQFTATIMMVISVSPAIAPTIGGFIVSHFGWEMNFYFLMLFGFFAVIMVWIWLPETNGYRKEPAQSFSFFKNYARLFKDPSYGLLCFILGVQFATIFCYFTLSPYLFMSYFGWSAQDYGYIGITGALGNIAGFGFARRLAHRIHFHQGILMGSFLCFLLSFTFVVACLFFPIKAYLLVLYVVCFFCISALAIVNATAAAMNLHPTMAGTSSAMVGAIQIGAGAVGSALASILPISPCAAGVTMGILSFLSFLAGILIKKK
jgi:MFS transporter, DHA1 family, multidrug resistance protein